MRTTVTLDPDTEQIVRARMAERGVSFKQALNDAIRDGVPVQREPVAPPTRTVPLGVPTVNLDKALQLASELEDEELVRKMRRRA
jgi:hypothetical protein